jgi:DNA adenine methylase
VQKDNTATQRQTRRLERLADQGFYRKSIIVHEKCNKVFESLKPYFANPNSVTDLKKIADKILATKPVNVAQVRQISPFRYPGGKTWLVPEIRKWVFELNYRPALFVEPFAGGGIASLSVIIEDLVDRVIMAELDPDVAAVWKTIFSDPDYLCGRILNFEVNRDNVTKIINSDPENTNEHAFKTIIKNRTQRGGIIAPGASLVKSGENGKGLKSRWYPETLVRRVRTINNFKSKIEFYEDDAFKIIRKFQNISDALFFIDPPYTAGGKKAGKRLYRFNHVSHENLFSEMAKVKGKFLMTYDDSNEVIELAKIHNFLISKIPMKNTHHEVKYELLIKKPN